MKKAPSSKVSSLVINLVKREAKKIKRDQGIPHHQALDVASQARGFSNFKHLLNNNPLVVVSKNVSVTKINSITKINPESDSVVFNTGAFLRGRYVQPNAKMSLTNHKKVATLLKEIVSQVHMRRSVSKHIEAIKNELDDWVQREYLGPEMTDEFFHSLYYGGQEQTMKKNITHEECNSLIDMMGEVRSILSSSYPVCPPVTKLFAQLDRSKNHLVLWSKRPATIEKENPKWRRDALIKVGTIISFKSGRGDRSAVVVRQRPLQNALDYYSHEGKGSCMRSSIKVPKEASFKEYWPLRLYLPYGMWTLEDGTEVLYTRDYKPIWWRSIDGKVSTREPEWVQGIVPNKSTSFFNDSNPPWKNAKSRELCEEVLLNWKVAGLKPKLLQMLHDLIAGGTSDKVFIN
jgi:hypothetical protein